MGMSDHEEGWLSRQRRGLAFQAEELQSSSLFNSVDQILLNRKGRITTTYQRGRCSSCQKDIFFQ